MSACKHSYNGLCKACADIKPYMQFKMCPDKCFKCKNCGYFWGSGASEEKIGKPVVFNGGSKREE